MSLNKLELKGKVCCAIMFLMLFSGLFAHNRNGVLLYYENLERPVADMTFSSFPGIHEYGLLFALSGNDGGLAYFTSYDSLSIFTMDSDIGVVSIAPDEANNRIFCAVVGFSNSDGLYEFNVETEEFELITYTEYPPHFVKRLSSGFYFGYGVWNMYGGLMHSTDGDVWEPIEFFDYGDVTDIAENGDGKVFISAYNRLYMGNNGNYSSFDAPYRIHDIFVRSHPLSDEVYIACGEGYEDDAVYRVEYEENEITGLTLINYFTNPQRLYQYGNQLVVGCNNLENSLFLVEPVENGIVTPLSIDEEYEINEIYCFEFYPLYTHNFIVGTNSGVYIFANLTSTEEQTLELTSLYALRNFPNPFNPSTTIQFSSENVAENEQITLEIYNIKGQKIRQFNIQNSKFKMNEIVWDGRDEMQNPVSSGVYLYQIKTAEKVFGTEKMLLLK